VKSLSQIACGNLSVQACFPAWSQTEINEGLRAVLVAHGAQYEEAWQRRSKDSPFARCWHRARDLLFALAPIPSFRVAAAFAIFAFTTAPNSQQESNNSSVLDLYSGAWQYTRAAGALGPSRLLSLGATCVQICQAQDATSSASSSPIDSDPFTSLLLRILDSTCWFGMMCDSAIFLVQRRLPTLSRVYGKRLFINQPGDAVKESLFNGLWDALNTRTGYAMAHAPAIIERINAPERSPIGSSGKDTTHDIDLGQLTRILLGGETLSCLLSLQILLTRHALPSESVSSWDFFSAAALVSATIRKNFSVYEPLYTALLTRFATAGLELQTMLFYLVSHLSLMMLEYFELLPSMDAHPARALGSNDVFALTDEERKSTLRIITSMGATLLKTVGRLQSNIERSGLSALPAAMPLDPLPWKGLYPELMLNFVHLTCKYLAKRAFAQLDLINALAPASPNLFELREILQRLDHSVVAYSAFRSNMPAIFDPARESRYQNIFQDQQRLRELCVQGGFVV
jgi:hypothetical protein